MEPADYEVFECLRKSRDRDTHEGVILVTGQTAAGIFPIVMFQPGKSPGLPKERASSTGRQPLLQTRTTNETATAYISSYQP